MEEIYLAVVNNVRPKRGGLKNGYTMINQIVLGVYAFASEARGKIYSTYEEHGDFFSNEGKRRKTLYSVETWSIGVGSDLEESEEYTVDELAGLEFVEESNE